MHKYIITQIDSIERLSNKTTTTKLFKMPLTPKENRSLMISLVCKPGFRQQEVNISKSFYFLQQVSLCNSSWSQTHDSPAYASLVLGLQA
jgi:hypothetical protein